jgi:hypothetical protein
MNVTRAFPYGEKVAITTGFGWDKGPDITSLPKSQQDAAKTIWPRFHKGVDLALLNSVIDKLSFSFYMYPILSPVDAKGAIYVAKDDQGVSNLRLVGDWFEVRIKHMIYNELSRDILAIMDAKRDVPAGTRLGPTGNVGLSFGAAPSYGRHLHYSFLTWGEEGEAYLKEKLSDGWNHDIAPELVAKNGAIVETIMGRGGIQWVGENVIRKSWDPFLQRACYECNPQALGM